MTCPCVRSAGLIARHALICSCAACQGPYLGLHGEAGATSQTSCSTTTRFLGRCQLRLRPHGLALSSVTSAVISSLVRDLQWFSSRHGLRQLSVRCNQKCRPTLGVFVSCRHASISMVQTVCPDTGSQLQQLIRCCTGRVHGHAHGRQGHNCRCVGNCHGCLLKS